MIFTRLHHKFYFVHGGTSRLPAWFEGSSSRAIPRGSVSRDEQTENLRTVFCHVKNTSHLFSIIFNVSFSAVSHSRKNVPSSCLKQGPSLYARISFPLILWQWCLVTDFWDCKQCLSLQAPPTLKLIYTQTFRKWTSRKCKFAFIYLFNCQVLVICVANVCLFACFLKSFLLSGGDWRQRQYCRHSSPCSVSPGVFTSLFHLIPTYLRGTLGLFHSDGSSPNQGGTLQPTPEVRINLHEMLRRYHQFSCAIIWQL